MEPAARNGSSSAAITARSQLSRHGLSVAVRMHHQDFPDQVASIVPSKDMDAAMGIPRKRDGATAQPRDRETPSATGSRPCARCRGRATRVKPLAGPRCPCYLLIERPFGLLFTVDEGARGKRSARETER
jgi:hypothetical protein